MRQRDAIPFREIATVTVKRYPNRAKLALALFIGQAFLYNAVTFDAALRPGWTSPARPEALAPYAAHASVGEEPPADGAA